MLFQLFRYLWWWILLVLAGVHAPVNGYYGCDAYYPFDYINGVWRQPVPLYIIRLVPHEDTPRDIYAVPSPYDHCP
jgi:hypothetical protein